MGPTTVSQVGMQDVDLLPSRFNNKLDRFDYRYRASIAETVDALVAPWGKYSVIYALLFLKLLLLLLCRIETSNTYSFGLTQADWQSELIKLLEDGPFARLSIFCPNDLFTILLHSC